MFANITFMFANIYILLLYVREHLGYVREHLISRTYGLAQPPDFNPWVHSPCSTPAVAGVQVQPTCSPKPKFSTPTSIFQRSEVSIYDTRASWGAPESKNSSDLGFVARPSFEVGQIDRLANDVHLNGSHPLVPSPCAQANALLEMCAA